MKHLIASHFLRVICLGMVLFLGGSASVYSQTQTRSSNKASVVVTFMLVSTHLDARAISLNNVPSKTIDLNKYPDARIHVKVNVQSVKSGYALRICNSCFPKNINGFGFQNFTGPKSFSTAGETTIVYSIDPSNIVEGKNDRINLTLQVTSRSDQNNVDFEWKKGMHSASFKVKTQNYDNDNRGEVVITDESVRKLQELKTGILEAIEDNDDGIIQGICNEINTLSAASQEARTILSEVRQLCNSKQRGGKQTDEEIWNATKAAANQKSKLHEREKIYKKFVKDNPKNKYVGEAQATIARIQQQTRDIMGSDDDDSVPAPPDPGPDIAKKFFISVLEQKELGNRVKITLEFENSGDKYPTLIVCGGGNIKVEEQKSRMRAVLFVDKGEVCEIEAVIKGVNFSPVRNNNKYTINTLVPPVTAKFETQEEGSMLITVEGGEAPYQLRFLKGGSVVGLMNLRLDVNNQFRLDKGNANFPGNGDYIFQVVDRTGNNNVDARSEIPFQVGNKFAGILTKLLVPLGLLILGVIAFLVYRQSKKNVTLSEEEEAKITAKIRPRGGDTNSNLGGASTTTTTSSEERSAEAQATENIRKSIKVSKKTSPTITPSPSVSAKSKESNILPVTAYPKLKQVDINPIVNELLMGKPQEYRKLSLLGDLWAQSFVSELYIRELVAYRIEQFVFQENKAFLSGKGETIPEIGGWLMGKHKYDEANDKYMVSFERFIQIQRRDSTDTKLIFDANAWQVLERAKDAYAEENLEVVGWFHTHPGWGVFLSHEDINTHETYFTEPYHIAMEMETVKEPHDVGFFTRWKGKGKLVLNNRATTYYRWEDFRKWLGK